jgi:peptidoglycan/xylan/chitin deacetylase (PgdA/CDA1 family)
VRPIAHVAGVLLVLAVPLAEATSCKGTLYLTLDTGNMAYAEAVAQTLARHDVRATFFLANERTTRGDHALDATWQDYWRARVAEGHKFGTHTWRHGKVVGDAPEGAVRYRPEFPPGPVETMAPAAYCAELKRVDDAFRGLTGRALDPLWRAPGGRTSPNALAAATGCGFRHVGWSEAGFLGDELPSDKYPNRVLVERTVAGVRDGDVLLMHLGIWSRKEPYAPMLDELLTRLRGRGFCFATVGS